MSGGDTEGFSAIETTHQGTALRGWITRPEGRGPFPAVLVMHHALGIGKQVFAAARRLQALGYLAVVTDMFGADADISTPAASGQHYKALSDVPGKLRDRVVHWRDVAAAHMDADAGRISAIGYCFGGSCVLELARSGADVKAVASFHGILSTQQPAAPGAIKAEVAVWTGARDPYAPMQAVDAFRSEMTAAGARHQVTVFSEAAHSFTDPWAAEIGMPGIEYHAMADKVSWAGTIALLAELS